MLSRRGFLGTLMASIVGTAFVPSELLWVPAPVTALPVLTPAALVTLQAITREAAVRLARRIALPVQRGPARLGFDGLTAQFGVDMQLPGTLEQWGVDAQRYIEPAMAAMANHVQHARWTRYGELTLPKAFEQTCVVTADGVSVRGVMAYDHMREAGVWLLRLDAIGGGA